MSAKLSLADPAELFRSRADFREEMRPSERELIGSGDLAKMIRLAISDPDGDFWKYAIRVENRILEGVEITRQGKALTSEPLTPPRKSHDD